MSGKFALSVIQEQRAALAALAGSRDRGEADRSRAVLLERFPGVGSRKGFPRG
jgi:hypothetical protein